MTIILLIIIYLAFISLGLPDSMIGVAWPSISADWGVSLDSAGLVAIFVIAGNVASSLMCSYFIKRFGTGKITFASCLMTGLALLGFSFAPSYIWLLVFAVPLGLGGGMVDASLNNYVALHYKSHHMNWLHSFWGVGATLGPVIMGQVFAAGLSWNIGCRRISIIQLSLAAILFISLPLWNKHSHEKNLKPQENIKHKLIDREVFKIKGVKYAFAVFGFYCAAELSIGLWGSSFLVHARNMPVETAAFCIAVYYGSIAAGRVLSGFISFKVSNKNMIRYGAIIAIIGAVLFIIPLPKMFAVIPFAFAGLGLSPIFPAMMHETPIRFGKDASQAIIGYQMASAYGANVILPPIFGLIIENVSMMLFPFLIVGCMIIMLLSTERINSIIKAG